MEHGGIGEAKQTDGPWRAGGGEIFGEVYCSVATSGAGDPGGLECLVKVCPAQAIGWPGAVSPALAEDG